MGESKKTYAYDPTKKRLTVRGAESFPREAFDYVDELEVLDISFGHLTSLPHELGRFKKLRVAFFSNNDFEEVPEVLSTCENLAMVGFKSCNIRKLPDHALPQRIRGLILTDNQLTILPASIGNYTALKKLMLAGNQLQTLPEEIMACQKLELLRLSVNNLTSAPDWLFTLPRLGWYADAGNPFHDNQRVHVQGLTETSWNDIVIGEKLGKSANNTVYRGRLHNRDVAIKMYGADLSTDGLTIDDMNACLLAGDHGNIIGGIGKIIDAPDNLQGLVMPLIPDEFKKLGNPPDLHTFTRDVYAQTEKFSLPYIRQILTDVASAMKHCHAKGIMHGDLYAHNILTNDDGKSYLGDFGAASLYKPYSKEGKLRELVDVAGFGYLIEDLLSHATTDATAQKDLQDLKQACLAAEVTARPTFGEIYSLLVK